MYMKSAYEKSGVDIQTGNNLVRCIKEDVQSTHNSNVIGTFGGFAGMFRLGNEYKSPILVSCTDGVGTKVSLAQEYRDLSGIGQDLVAMCVNDLVTCGAKPLFFLDYFASSKLDLQEAAYVIKSIATACKFVNCALLGGETAEMPGHYINNKFDLAGFSVGCVDEENMIDNTKIKEGDVIIGIESSGPHSNGFSLIRKILQDNRSSIDNDIINQLLKPTHLYSPLILELQKKYDIHGIAHITGGGITENLPRIIPDSLCANVCKSAWQMPDIFVWLQKTGNITSEEMFQVFNCGIGMILIIDTTQNESIQNKISENGFRSYLIGKVQTDANVKMRYS